MIVSRARVWLVNICHRFVHGVGVAVVGVQRCCDVAMPMVHRWHFPLEGSNVLLAECDMLINAALPHYLGTLDDRRN